jgi:hypothetical protein
MSHTQSRTRRHIRNKENQNREDRGIDRRKDDLLRGCRDGRMDGWMDGWTDGRMDGLMEGRTDGWMNG